MSTPSKHLLEVLDLLSIAHWENDDFDDSYSLAHHALVVNGSNTRTLVRQEGQPQASHVACMSKADNARPPDHRTASTPLSPSAAEEITERRVTDHLQLPASCTTAQRLEPAPPLGGGGGGVIGHWRLAPQ